MMKATWALLSTAILAGYSAYTGGPVNAESASAQSAPVMSAPAKPAASDVRLTMPPANVTPADLNVLFWNDAQRAARFREMERWFPGFEVPASPKTRMFDKGDAYSEDLQQQIAKFVQDTNVAGIMVIKDGQLRHEAYGLDFDAKQRWTSFSVAKSFTSTLLGAALKDGHIASLDDSVAKYLPEMAGSAYEDVTVKQLATMTSGVRWNESYTDPNSDVAKMGEIVAADGEDAIVTQLKALPREAPAGEKFVYKTVKQT